MEYKELSRLYHMDASAERDSISRKLAEERRRMPSTFDLAFETPAGRLFVAMPREMIVLYELILRAERKASALMHSLPPIARFALVRGLVLEEVVSTNAIEQIQSTRQQVADALDASQGANLEAKRFKEIALLYLGLDEPEGSLPETPEDIRAIYDRVMAGELSEGQYPDGELFRKGGVNITAGGVRVVRHGLEPEARIREAMEFMLALVRRPDVPEIISALASHYVFEYAHPFYDGNGRTGRYLLALFLREPLSMATVLSLSRAITENRKLYYDAFSTVENPLNRGELTFFVYNMLELVRIGQSTVLETLETSLSRFEEVSAKAKEMAIEEGLSAQERNVVSALVQFDLFGALPSASLDDVASCMGLGKQMARKHVAKLEERGLVKKTRNHPLAFALSESARERTGLRALA